MVGFSAVGSLREEVKPRDFCVAGGVVDWTKGVSQPALLSFKRSRAEQSREVLEGGAHHREQLVLGSGPDSED